MRSRAEWSYRNCECCELESEDDLHPPVPGDVEGVPGVGWGCPHIVGFNSRHPNQNLAELEILSCCDGCD